MLLTSCMIFTCKESRRSNNFIWASLTNEYSSPNNKRNKNEEDGCSVDVVCVRDRLLTFEIAMNGNSSTVKTIVAFLMKHQRMFSQTIHYHIEKNSIGPPLKLFKFLKMHLKRFIITPAVMCSSYKWPLTTDSECRWTSPSF